MSVQLLLDELVPRDERPADWDDVLRRAVRRRPRRRVALTVAVAAAALLVAPALAVLLRSDRGPQLPAAADRSRVAVVMEPRTGRMLVKLAPWRDHDGFCFAALLGRSGCAASGSAFLSLNTGYTFDRRVVSGDAVRLDSGKRVPLTLSHFHKLGVTLFYGRRDALRLLWRVELRDAAGHVLHTIRNRPRR
jgi:hypothetical protein